MGELLTTDLLSDFTQSNVDWLRRTAARHPSLSAEEWPQVAIACEIIAKLAKTIRDGVYSRLERGGIEAGILRIHLERMLVFLDDAVQMMGELQAAGGEAAPGAGPALDRIRLARVEAAVARDDLASLLRLAKAEPRPVPKEVLDAAKAGPFIRLDELRKRR